MAFKPSVKTEDLRQTLQDITDLLMTMRKQQMQQEAYGMVSPLGRAITEEAQRLAAAIAPV
jgi:hypothetical protein